MKAKRTIANRALSALLCCLLLLLPLGMTAGAAHEEGPGYQEDLSRASYISEISYGLQRVGTTNSIRFWCDAHGVSGVTNIKVWVEFRRCPPGGGANDWYVYANENTDSRLQGAGFPLKYSTTIGGLPNGTYEATYTVRLYKLLIYQTYEYTTPMVSIY